MQILLSWILQEKPVQPVRCTPALMGLPPSPGCWGGCSTSSVVPTLLAQDSDIGGTLLSPRTCCGCFMHWCNGRNHLVLPQAANRGRSCNTSRTSALVTPWVLFVSYQCITLVWRFILDERRRSSSAIVGFPWFCLVFPGFSPGSHLCCSLSPPWAHRQPEESSAGPAPVGCPRGS